MGVAGGGGGRGRVEERITALWSRAARSLETRPILESNIRLLERRRALFEECVVRDTRVAAQLDAFPDAFELILGQVSATQFDSAGVVEYMDSLASQVADTEEFVAAMQPVTDDLLSDVAFAAEGMVQV